MLIVAGTITIEPTRVLEFEEAIAALIDEVRHEDGCLHYSVLVENRTTGLFNITEIWRDEDAFRTHWEQPITVANNKKFESNLLGMTLKIYDVSGVRSMSDVM